MPSPKLKPLRLLDVLSRTGYSMTALIKLMSRGDFPQKPWTEEKVAAWVKDREEGKPYPSGKENTWKRTKAPKPISDPSTRDYYTSTEVRAISGVIHKVTFNMWVAKGIFPDRIPGQGSHWDKAEVDAWRADRDKGYPMLYPVVHPPFAHEYARWQATGAKLEDIEYGWTPSKRLAVRWLGGRKKDGFSKGFELLQPSQGQEPVTAPEISFLEQPPGQSTQQAQAPVPLTCQNCTAPTTPNHIHCTTCEFLLKYGHLKKFEERKASSP